MWELFAKTSGPIGPVSRKRLGQTGHSLGQLGQTQNHTHIFKVFSMVGSNMARILNMGHGNKANVNHWPSLAICCVRCDTFNEPKVSSFPSVTSFLIMNGIQTRVF